MWLASSNQSALFQSEIVYCYVYNIDSWWQARHERLVSNAFKTFNQDQVKSIFYVFQKILKNVIHYKLIVSCQNVKQMFFHWNVSFRLQKSINNQI